MLSIISNIFNKEKNKPQNKIPKGFPLVNSHLIIKCLQRIKVRPFYDSVWEIKGETVAGEELCISVTRWDTETKEEMCELIKGMTDVSEIKDLDLRNSIYYD